MPANDRVKLLTPDAKIEYRHRDDVPALLAEGWQLFDPLPEQPAAERQPKARRFRGKGGFKDKTDYVELAADGKALWLVSKDGTRHGRGQRPSPVRKSCPPAR